MNCKETRQLATVIALVGTALSSWCATAQAGPRTLGAGPTPPKKPAEPPPRAGPAATGKGTMVKGWIKGLTAAKNAEHEDLVGVLKFLPDEKNGKVLSLNVYRREGVDFKLGDAKLDFDNLSDMLWAGLYCTVSWAPEASSDPKKKSNQKQLNTLSLEVIEISGTLEEISDDFIVVKGKPMRGDWPDKESAKVAAPSRSGQAEGPVKSRVLKVKHFEKISRFLNKEGKNGDAGEYQTGDKVDVTMAFGSQKTPGIMAYVRHTREGVVGEPNPVGKPTPKPPTPQPGRGPPRKGGG